MHGLAVQPGGVGVFDSAGFAGNAAGYAYAYRYAGSAGAGFGLLYQCVDGVQGGLVVAGRGGYPFAEVFVGLVIQQDHFGFGAAQVYAYQTVFHEECFSRCGYGRPGTTLKESRPWSNTSCHQSTAVLPVRII